MPEGTSAALHAALTERNADLEQCDQAYREIDELCQERNRLKGVINRRGCQFMLEMAAIGGHFDEMRAVIERDARSWRARSCRRLSPTDNAKNTHKESIGRNGDA